MVVEWKGKTDGWGQTVISHHAPSLALWPRVRSTSSLDGGFLIVKWEASSDSDWALWAGKGGEVLQDSRFGSGGPAPPAAQAGEKRNGENGCDSASPEPLGSWPGVLWGLSHEERAQGGSLAPASFCFQRRKVKHCRPCSEAVQIPLHKDLWKADSLLATLWDGWSVSIRA